MRGARGFKRGEEEGGEGGGELLSFIFGVGELSVGAIFEDCMIQAREV